MKCTYFPRKQIIAFVNSFWPEKSNKRQLTREHETSLAQAQYKRGIYHNINVKATGSWFNGECRCTYWYGCHYRADFLHVVARFTHIAGQIVDTSWPPEIKVYLQDTYYDLEQHTSRIVVFEYIRCFKGTFFQFMC